MTCVEARSCAAPRRCVESPPRVQLRDGEGPIRHSESAVSSFRRTSPQEADPDCFAMHVEVSVVLQEETCWFST